MTACRRVSSISLATATGVVLVLSVLIGASPSNQNDVDTTQWNLWAWPDECGALQVQHPREWKTRLGFQDQAGCGGEISYLPAGFSSLAKAPHGIVLNLSYSERSAVDDAVADAIATEVAKSPERAIRTAQLECARNPIVEIPSAESIRCFARNGKGVYLVIGDVRNTDLIDYTTRYTAILSSVRVPGLVQ